MQSNAVFLVNGYNHKFHVTAATTDFCRHLHVEIMSSVGVPDLIRSSAVVMAFIDAESSVSGYAAIVYPIFFSS